MEELVGDDIGLCLGTSLAIAEVDAVHFCLGIGEAQNTAFLVVDNADVDGEKRRTLSLESANLLFTLEMAVIVLQLR